MANAASMPPIVAPKDARNRLSSNEPIDLHSLLLAILGRHSTNPIDKVCAIAFPFQRRAVRTSHNITFPIYDPNTPISVAWEGLISIIASAKMVDDLVELRPKFPRSTTIQLLCLFPHPSRHHWFPSWTQVQQYPDVSVPDNDPVPVTGEKDYSLRIMSGRIYRGCSLVLKQPPTSEGKAVYHCFMGSKLVELAATVPGVESNIDSRSTYVLVDISPDKSLWPRRCLQPQVKHVHQPIWSNSVIIVCEEMDNLAQPVQVTTRSPAILRYRLRRITTLLWDWKIQNPRWLPFKPSLEHIRSVVCSAEGGLYLETNSFPPDVFCDPDPPVVARLWFKKRRRDWDKCPLYEVYLV